MGYVWINGQFEDEASASISLRDTGLLHGAGVFTTMRASGGRAFCLIEHLARLRASCEALFIPLTLPDATLVLAAREILERNQLAEARMRLTVTRGPAATDPLHGKRLEPTAFLTAARFEPYPAEFYERGLTVILMDEQKLNPYDLQAGHKTLNYLSRLAALREASRRGAGEALWFDVQNFLQSGSISNVFIVSKGNLLTPPTAADLRGQAADFPRGWRSPVLPGITRNQIVQVAKDAGIGAMFTPIDVEMLLAADEVFLTNSVMGVMPVCHIERKAIGSSRPGEISLTLGAAYNRLLAEHRTAAA